MMCHSNVMNQKQIVEASVLEYSKMSQEETGEPLYDQTYIANSLFLKSKDQR